MNASKGIVYLCGCAVHERTPDKEIVDSLDLPELYSLAVRHSLASIVGLVLQRADVHDPKFDMAVDSAYRKTVRTSLVVQWLRFCLPMQGTWVSFPVGELRSHKSQGN